MFLLPIPGTRPCIHDTKPPSGTSRSYPVLDFPALSASCHATEQPRSRCLDIYDPNQARSCLGQPRSLAQEAISARNSGRPASPGVTNPSLSARLAVGSQCPLERDAWYPKPPIKEPTDLTTINLKSDHAFTRNLSDPTRGCVPSRLAQKRERLLSGSTWWAGKQLLSCRSRSLTAVKYKGSRNSRHKKRCPPKEKDYGMTMPGYTAKGQNTSQALAFQTGTTTDM